MKSNKIVKAIFPIMFAVIPLTGCNSGTSFTAKDVNVYFPNTTTSSATQKLYFSKSYNGIPYIDLNDGVEFMKQFHKSADPHASLTVEKNGETFKMIRENGAFITFNFEYNYVTSNDINKFKSMSFAKTSMDGRGNDDSFYDKDGKKIEGEVRFITTKGSEVFETKPKTTTMFLDGYNIKTFKQGDKYLVPFTTFYNIAGYGTIACLYNGQELFVTSNSLGPTSEQYYKFEKQKRSKELIEYNYYEFCRDLDYVYGLQDEHGISNFDTYFTNNGLKDKLLSEDRYDEDYAYLALQHSYLADSHTGFSFQNAYGGLDPEEITKIGASLKFSPEYMQRQKKVAECEYARKNYKNIGDNKKVLNPIFQNDDTLFITFDSFTFDSFSNPAVDTYYTEEYKNSKKTFAEAGDTCSIISYANDLIHEDLKSSTPTIKNVVLDLSGNHGGAADAAMFVLAWFDSAVMQLVDPISDATSAISYQADINFDKKIDYNDFLLFSNPGDKIALEKEGIKTFNGNVYCITSETSFSCGNYVPAMLKQSGLVKLVGTKSGGGACIVHVTGTADGTGLQFSSNHKLCMRKNGSYYSIDQGVDPDYSLFDYETLYGGDTTKGYSDRSNLKKYLPSLK